MLLHVVKDKNAPGTHAGAEIEAVASVERNLKGSGDVLRSDNAEGLSRTVRVVLWPTAGGVFTQTAGDEATSAGVFTSLTEVSTDIVSA